ncbi:MAG: hypothetical protein Q7S92_02745 [Candidatus Diapherotrites archaeon]|nr:hypothetical protein [Candidatus Diapherotrites archaeon]
MKKGFIFTIDAITALLLVMALVGLFATSQENNPTVNVPVDSLNQKTLDQSIAFNYFNQTGNQASTPTAQYRACNIQYIYDFTETQLEKKVKERKICEEI